jgi:hypothetical protein
MSGFRLASPRFSRLNSLLIDDKQMSGFRLASPRFSRLNSLLIDDKQA